MPGVTAREFIGTAGIPLPLDGLGMNQTNLEKPEKKPGPSTPPQSARLRSGWQSCRHAWSITKSL